MPEQSIFAINNTGIFLTLSQRLNEDLSITALQLFDPLIQTDNLPATIEETAGQYAPVDPRNSAQRPLRPAGMVQWRHAGIRDSPSARGGWRSCIPRLPDRHMDSGLSQTPRLAAIETRGLHLSVGVNPVGLGHGAFRAKVFLGLHCRSRNRAPFLPPRSDRQEAFAEPAYAAAQVYDHWLLDYTTAMLKAYEPKPISGRLTIFRSTSEPAGRFLDPKLGWGGMAARRRPDRCSGRSLYSLQGTRRFDHGKVYRGSYAVRRRRRSATRMRIRKS